MVSDANAAAPNAELAQPIVDELAGRAPTRVLAAEAGRDAKGNQPAQRAQFVGPFRAESNLPVSTVDDLEQFAGRVAAVFALQAMARRPRSATTAWARARPALLPDAPA